MDVDTDDDMDVDMDVSARLDAGTDAPAVRVVEQLLRHAHAHRASDVHLEPRREGVQVRWRIDGVLVEGPRFPYALHGPLLARLKVLAELNLVERRRPQDGQFRLQLSDPSGSDTLRGDHLDVRVATMPTITGERAVLRLAHGGHGRRRLDDLGLPAAIAERLGRMLRAPSGMVICAGPTGAGKTTTLYAALGELHDGTRHLATIEDPVEHVLDGTTQIQVSDTSGLTFSAALRALLRHDPDVVLLGEIRDRETAQVAVQAALSGHLVLTTLHATDTVAALTRLVDLGVDRYLVAAAVTAVVAQRLLRRVRPDDAAAFEGRVGAFELLVTHPAVRALLVDRASEDDLRVAAVRHGLRPLRLAADDLVAAGHTTRGEVVRILHLDDVACDTPAGAC